MYFDARFAARKWPHRSPPPFRDTPPQLIHYFSKFLDSNRNQTQLSSFRTCCDMLSRFRVSRISVRTGESPGSTVAPVACNTAARSVRNTSAKALCAAGSDSCCINRARAVLLAAPTNTCRYPTRRGAVSGNITTHSEVGRIKNVPEIVLRHPYTKSGFDNLSRNTPLPVSGS